MEVSALKYSGGIGLHARSPLLRLQSDERLVALVRRGNSAAFEALVSRYDVRLLAFCRHMLGSREDAEDVLQEVLAASFNAMLADDRPINVKPWLYRIARNRSLNHLRRIQAVGVDSMDVHFSDNGASTADKVHEREEFRLLVGDINELPETQKTALVLREMDALSYEQIAEAMETTVPSVKSLLVRARISLAEASEARVLSCDEVRLELGEMAEGLRRRPSPLVRRHLRGCKRCSTFRAQLKQTNKALAAFLPIGPLVILKKLAFTHLGHSAGSSATGAGAAGSTAAAGSTIMAGSGAGGFVSAGLGAIATKAAAGLAAAALVTAGAVEVDQPGRSRHRERASTSLRTAVAAAPVVHHAAALAKPHRALVLRTRKLARKKTVSHGPILLATAASKPAIKVPFKAPVKPPIKPPVKTVNKAVATTLAPPAPTPPAPAPAGRMQTQTDATVLSPSQTTPTTASTTETTPSPTSAPVIPPEPSTPASPPPTTTTAPAIPPPPSDTGSTPPDGSSGAGGSSYGPGAAGDPGGSDSPSSGATTGARTSPSS